MHRSSTPSGLLPKKQGHIQDSISREGWAGAVIWRAGTVGDAVYMTGTVACDCAGAVMQKPLAKRRKRRKSKGVTDPRTHGPTDPRTDSDL